jgi:putative aldouronate transport system permease protein
MENSEQTGNNVKTKSERITNLVIHIIFIIICGICLYSFLIIVGSSFKTQQDIMDYGYSVIPQHFSLDAYKMVLENPTQLLNSYVITIITTVIGSLAGVWITSSYAYVISRKNYRYKKGLSFYVFFTMLFNGGLVTFYIHIVKWMGLKDNILSLILPMLVNAWYILVMKGFFQSIPESLIESAKIDGAGEFYTFIKIVISILNPAIPSIALFYVLGYCNDWWLSMIFIESEKLMKLQYMLIKILKNMEFLNSAAAFKLGAVKAGMEAPTLGARMAMCVLAAGPVLMIFPFFQKYFVKGITVGAVKG